MSLRALAIGAFFPLERIAATATVASQRFAFTTTIEQAPVAFVFCGGDELWFDWDANGGSKVASATSPGATGPAFGMFVFRTELEMVYRTMSISTRAWAIVGQLIGEGASINLRR